MLQLEAVTIISNFALLISENSDHDDDGVERNGDDNRKKSRIIKYDRERAYNSVMTDYICADSRLDDKQFERQFLIMPSIFEYIFRCLAVNNKILA